MKVQVLLLSLVVAAFASPVFAGNCEFNITGNDQMQFDQREMKIKAADCKEITVTLKHDGKLAANIMGHNWVLVKTSDLGDVSRAAMSAGVSAGYLPKDRSKVIAATDLIGGGENATVTFSTGKVKAGEDYSFFCSYPGHMALMKGSFIVE